MLAFNGSYKGRPAILAHVYGTEPVPTSFTLPFVISRAKGTSYKGKRRSHASAGCPAPKGFPGATFPFAKASYSFAGGRTLSSTLTRSCRARG
jgi:hypothetical protein